MMQRMHLAFITIACIFLAECTNALSKDYIDLLDLSDNDEFLWGSRENVNIRNGNSNGNNKYYTNKNDDDDNNNYHNNSYLNQYEARHILNKRQTQTDGELLQENKAYGACRTPSGEAGYCRHIIYCRLPELKNDVWRVVSQLCIIEKSTIGICCPDRLNSRSSPQIISNANDDSLRDPRVVNHPEQRGCGITTKQFPRITGGRPAEPDEWPWMAALLRPGIPYVWCGGVLVTDRHVMTAAHCLHKINTNEIYVRLGEYDTHEFNETRARDFRIAAAVLHIDYDPLTFENDIALIRVQRPALFNTYIWPVCMPPISENWEEQVGVVTGWGSQSFGGPQSDILMEVLLPVWKQDDCRNAIVERIPDTVLCAGVRAGGQDSCQGDSGGPLLLQLPNNRWVTIGIVSWGVRCGEANRPGMYTRVDKYLHWIIENSDI